MIKIKQIKITNILFINLVIFLFFIVPNNIFIDIFVLLILNINLFEFKNKTVYKGIFEDIIERAEYISIYIKDKNLRTIEHYTCTPEMFMNENLKFKSKISIHDKDGKIDYESGFIYATADHSK